MCTFSMIKRLGYISKFLYKDEKSQSSYLSLSLAIYMFKWFYGYFNAICAYLIKKAVFPPASLDFEISRAFSMGGAKHGLA